MDQRLVSENIMQCNDQSTPTFSAAGHLVAFKTNNGIRVKAFNKEIRECNVKVEDSIRRYFLKNIGNRHYLNIECEQGTV